jgi:hypothetical protein
VCRCEQLEADLRRRVSAAADDGRTPLHAWTERVLLSSTDSNPGLVRVVTGLLCPPGVVLDKTDREGGMSALHMACGGMFLADERLKSHDCTPVSPEIAKRLIDVRVPACDFPLACLFFCLPPSLRN